MGLVRHSRDDDAVAAQDCIGALQASPIPRLLRDNVVSFLKGPARAHQGH